LFTLEWHASSPLDSKIGCAKKRHFNFECVADDECCAGTLKYFGSNSSLPSRNCFCVPSVYERFTAGTVVVDVDEYFGVCT